MNLFRTSDHKMPCFQLSNLVPLDHNGVPLPRALPDFQTIESPLDVSVKTLDQLSAFSNHNLPSIISFAVLEMYSKNDSKSLNISEKNNVTATFLKDKETSTTATTTTTTTENSTLEPATTKTEIFLTPKPIVTDRSMKYSEDQNEASGLESSGEESGEAPEESSGTSEYTEEEAEASGTKELSRTIRTGSSEEEESSGAVSSAQESSGEASGENSEVNESSGVENDDESSGSGIQESSGYSDDVILYSM